MPLIQIWPPDPNPITEYINVYDCPCGAQWEDVWTAMCDDDCDWCGTTCSPTESREA